MKKSEARRELKVVGIGLLLGLLCAVFGVFWAVYMTVYNEEIHRGLSLAERAYIEEIFVLSARGGHEAHGMGQENGLSHTVARQPYAGDGHHGHEGHDTAYGADGFGAHAGNGAHGGHDYAPVHSVESPDMRAAHERLSKAHAHAMGLGALTIGASLMLAFIPVRPWVRALAAGSLGTGSFFYPLALIISGLRTTALGEAGAVQSVFPMAALSVFLSATGLLAAAALLIIWLFSGDD